MTGPRTLGPAITALIALAGCHEKTEDERLTAMLDSTVVHVYVGARTVVTGTSNDPALATARRALGEVLTATDDAPEKRLVRTAKLLAGLAEVGKNPLAQDRGPLVPALMTLVAPGATMPAGFGVDEDHAFLGASWWVLKAHPDAPGVPHMDLFSLWEVTRISERGLQASPMRAVARVIRAIQFADHDLCKKAAAETSALRGRGVSMRPAMELAGATGHSAAEVEQFDRVTRVAASGSTAICYLQRKDRPAALPHIEALTNDAAAVGVPATKVAMLRAYVAFEKGDVPGAIRALEQARQDPDLDAEDRATVQRLIGYLKKRSDTEFVAAVTDRAFLADVAARVVFRFAQQSGVGQQIRQSPAGRSVERYGDRVTRAVSSLDPAAAVGQGAAAIRKRLGQ